MTTIDSKYWDKSHVILVSSHNMSKLFSLLSRNNWRSDNYPNVHSADMVKNRYHDELSELVTATESDIVKSESSDKWKVSLFQIWTSMINSPNNTKSNDKSKKNKELINLAEKRPIEKLNNIEPFESKKQALSKDNTALIMENYATLASNIEITINDTATTSSDIPSHSQSKHLTTVPEHDFNRIKVVEINSSCVDTVQTILTTIEQYQADHIGLQRQPSPSELQPLLEKNKHKDVNIEAIVSLSTLLLESNIIYCAEFPIYLNPDLVFSRPVEMAQYYDYFLGDTNVDEDENENENQDENVNQDEDVNRDEDEAINKSATLIQTDTTEIESIENAECADISEFKCEMSPYMQKVVQEILFLNGHSFHPDVPFDSCDVFADQYIKNNLNESNNTADIYKYDLSGIYNKYIAPYKSTAMTTGAVSIRKCDSGMPEVVPEVALEVAEIQKSVNTTTYDTSMCHNKWGNVNLSNTSSATSPTPLHALSQFRFIELFSGIGGFGYGLEALGGHCVMSCEIEETARRVYLDNFDYHAKDASALSRNKIDTILLEQKVIWKKKMEQEDEKCDETMKIPTISEMQPTQSTQSTQYMPSLLFKDVNCLQKDSIPDHDVLTAGFPCQPFSRLGKQPGFEDKKKGMLFAQVARIAYEKQPKLLVLENVPGLVMLEGGMTLLLILRAISRANYAVAYKVVDAKSLVPQYRRRIYIFGIRRDLLSLHNNQDESREEGEMNNSITSTMTSPRFMIPDIPDLRRDIRWMIDSKTQIAPYHILPKEKWEKVLNIKGFDTKVHWKIAGFSRPAGTLVTSYRRGYLYNSQFVSLQQAKIWEQYHDEIATSIDSIMNNYETESGSESEVHKHTDIQQILTKDTTAMQLLIDKLSTSPHMVDTLASTSDDFRFYTENECVKIMGFPTYIKLQDRGVASSKSYGLLGNAVCPPIITAICGSALKYIVDLDGTYCNTHTKPQPTSTDGSTDGNSTDPIMERAIAVAFLSMSEYERIALISRYNLNK